MNNEVNIQIQVVTEDDTTFIYPSTLIENIFNVEGDEKISAETKINELENRLGM